MATAPLRHPNAAPNHLWPSPEQFREQTSPFVRLVSTIWAIPHVKKVGATLGAHSFDLWVFTSEDRPEVEDQISAAERAYALEVCTEGFMLHVIPEGAIPVDAIPPYETIIER
ncbi:MAG: hypothetical protein U0893_26830 [Chloroflexota bacterium]